MKNNQSYSSLFLMLLLAKLLSLHNVNAQKMFTVDGLVFEQYNNDYGLSNNTILSFYKDSDDFIWLGTIDGLNILDGSEVQLFKGYQNKGNNFKGRTTLCIFEDSRNYIFCGTKNSGLNIYDKSQGEFINIDEALLKNAQSRSIKSVIEIDKLKYALLTNKEIIYFSLDAGNKIINSSRQELSLIEREYTHKLLIYNDEIFLNTNKRLLKVNSNNFTQIYAHKYLKPSKIKNGTFWVMNEEQIGYFSEDLLVINWIDYEFIHNPNYDNDYFIDFDVSPNNREIWIGAKHQLINLKLKEDKTIQSSLEVETKVESIGIMIDKLQNVFIRTNYNQGLVKFNGQQNQYNYIKFPEGYEKESQQNAFNEDDEGNYWISGNPGIFKYYTKSKTYHKWKNGTYRALPHLKINSQVRDSKGKFWWGTSNGIADYNAEQNTFNFYDNNSEDFWDSFAHHLDLDKDDHLWYISGKGLNRIDKTTKSHQVFEFEKINVIYIDENNILWVTDGGTNLLKYTIDNGIPKLERTYFIAEELKDFTTHNIYEDKFGRFWIVSFNGIYIYDLKNEEVVYHINRNNLLKTDRLYGITPDNRGNYWIGQFFFGHAICVSSETFEIIETSPNWMRREGATEIYSGPTDIDDNGKIFTDGTGGFFVYHPDSLQINEEPPKVKLHSVYLNGQNLFDNFLGSNALSYNGLKYDQNNIELGLKAVNPEVAYTTRYAYRLLGNSDAWNYTKELSAINFNGLPPNNYEFQVMSTSNGDVWSNPMTLASFNILPPWWQTTYAYLAYALIIGLLIYVLYRFQLNKKLAENEALKLKEVDDFKNEFYQNITHEFRTPLTVILGASENLKDKTSTTIKRNAKQLLNLVNELLDIGQIESNTSKLDLQNQDVVSFSKYCLESLQSLADQKKIQLNFIADSKNILMNFDANKYQLILNNLLSNALKFTPEKGNVTLQISEQNSKVTIRVIDDGVGIPEHDLEQVFERYYQTRETDRKSGSGIGLALTKELVKLMDGSILATNNLGEGACFTMIFPTVNIPSNDVLKVPQLGNLSSEEFDAHEHVILVIEDNADVMEYITSILPSKYAIFKALNGKQGVEQAIEIIPDVIISDVMMPLMNGYEVCEALKFDEKTNHIPVILLTAKADINSKIAGITYGADAYLSKPFNKTELLAQIDNLITLREKLKAKYSIEINDPTTSKSEFTDDFLQKVHDLLLDKIDDDNYSINEICKDLGVSRTQLHRKVKAISGLSSSIFIREIRLKEGYKLLLNGNLSVSEVAYSVGFSDPNYFTKLFTKKYGKTPSTIGLI